MKKIVLTVFSIFFLLFQREAAYGCSCVSTSLDEKIQQAEKIFVGKVVHKSARGVRLKVQRWWKGDASGYINLSINEMIGTNCDVQFERRQKYLIFARKSKHQSLPVTSICAGTSRLTEVSAEDLKKLGEGKPPVKQAEKM